MENMLSTRSVVLVVPKAHQAELNGFIQETFPESVGDTFTVPLKKDLLFIPTIQYYWARWEMREIDYLTLLDEGLDHIQGGRLFVFDGVSPDAVLSELGCYAPGGGGST